LVAAGIVALGAVVSPACLIAESIFFDGFGGGGGGVAVAPDEMSVDVGSAVGSVFEVGSAFEVGSSAGDAGAGAGGSMEAVDGRGDAAAIAEGVFVGGRLVDVTGGSSETSDAASSNRSSSECADAAAPIADPANFSPREAGPLGVFVSPPWGGEMSTIDPHFGQGWICPTAERSATLSDV
jgi:hypothetical protein